ncbi:FAD binding domain-containing protein [Xylaria grammica]|nr:FAD binding domain-containing protein [Xylaria grammica]
MLIQKALSVLAIVGVCGRGVRADGSSTRKVCRCMPEDPCWPSRAEWDRLNSTVQGHLIETIPLASTCHVPDYEEPNCQYLKESWPYAYTYVSSPSTVLAPLTQNQSCDPFTPPESPCRLGNTPAYVVNASSADHVAAALTFVRLHNIRLVVKSTGHDLLGKSGGAGSLSIWMHSFQNINFTRQYSGANTYQDYHGPAARIEPGLVTYQIYEAAQQAGLRVLGGTCNTVAIGGGYTPGGGHSLLSSKYGLAADNVLEWDVVTASGRRITATPYDNADLYWALSGGGGGVFAVVLGVTVKAFPDGIVSAAGLTFNVTSSPSPSAFWSAIEVFHRSMPEWLAHNAVAGYVIAEGVFSLQPLTLPDQSADALQSLITPFLSKLGAIGIPYSLNVTTFPSFLDLYATYYGPLPYGLYTDTQVQASRLLPRSIIESESEIKSLIDTQKYISDLRNGTISIVGTGLSLPNKPSAASSNSVLPAWRDTSIHQMIYTSWDWDATWASNLEKQETMINDVYPALTKIAPNSGTYMNEGNPAQVDWKEAFYGDNYWRLRTIKQHWDPDSLFYTHTGVGGDEWKIDANGRLCHA